MQCSCTILGIPLWVSLLYAIICLYSRCIMDLVPVFCVCLSLIHRAYFLNLSAKIIRICRVLLYICRVLLYICRVLLYMCRVLLYMCRVLLYMCRVLLYTSQGTSQIPTELKQGGEQFAMRSINLLFLFGIRRICLRSRRIRLLYLSIRKAIKQTVVIIGVYHMW
jgi:hypothetical protein